MALLAELSRLPGIVKYSGQGRAGGAWRAGALDGIRSTAAEWLQSSMAQKHAARRASPLLANVPGDVLGISLDSAGQPPQEQEPMRKLLAKARPRLSGPFHKYGGVGGEGFFVQARREHRAYPQ